MCIKNFCQWKHILNSYQMKSLKCEILNHKFPLKNKKNAKFVPKIHIPTQKKLTTKEQLSKNLGQLKNQFSEQIDPPGSPPPSLLTSSRFNVPDLFKVQCFTTFSTLNPLFCAAGEIIPDNMFQSACVCPLQVECSHYVTLSTNTQYSR